MISLATKVVVGSLRSLMPKSARADFEAGAELGDIFRPKNISAPKLGMDRAYGYHKDRTPTHGYEPTREAAMAAFAKSWRGGGKKARKLTAK